MASSIMPCMHPRSLHIRTLLHARDEVMSYDTSHRLTRMPLPLLDSVRIDATAPGSICYGIKVRTPTIEDKNTYLLPTPDPKHC